ncbi:unnamed protein product [Urochloa humidicola]
MPEDESEAAAQQTPCAGCKTLRRRCVPGCVFGPYFPADGGDDPSRFAAVHRVFGASNVARMLGVVAHPEDRRRAAETLVEEARARLRDPALGCHSYVAILQMLNEKAREQLDAARAEIAAAEEPVDLAAAPPEVRAEAREQTERALAQAREKDAKLLAARRANDVEWWQQHRAAKHAAGVPRGIWKKNRDTSKQVAAEAENTAAAAAAARESSSEQTMLTPPAAVGAEMESPQGNGNPSGKTAETQEPAAASEAAREDRLASEHAPVAAPPHHDSAATTQLAGAGTSFLDKDQLAAAEALAKRLDTIKRRWAAGQQCHGDPAAARHAAAGLDVAPRRMADAREEATAAAEAEAASGQDLMVMMLAQEFTEAGPAEQGMAMQMLAAGAAQHGDLATQYDDAVTLVHGHQDMRQQMTVAAVAGEVAGEQGVTVRDAAAAELAGQEMMQLAQAQYGHGQTELNITLGHVPPQEIVQQIAAAAKVATAEAELAGEQELIMQQVAAVELAREQKMALLLQVAAAQYSETGLDISLGQGQGHPYGHQPKAQEFAGEEEMILLQLADAVGVAGEPNSTAAAAATTTQRVAAAYKDSEHGSDYGATAAFQPPGLAEAVPLLVEQRAPPQGQTVSALGLQMDSSLLQLPLPPAPPLSLGQPHAQVAQQKSTDGGDKAHSSDLTAYLYY